MNSSATIQRDKGKRTQCSKGSLSIVSLGQTLRKRSGERKGICSRTSATQHTPEKVSERVSRWNADDLTYNLPRPLCAADDTWSTSSWPRRASRPSSKISPASGLQSSDCSGWRSLNASQEEHSSQDHSTEASSGFFLSSSYRQK